MILHAITVWISVSLARPCVRDQRLEVSRIVVGPLPRQSEYQDGGDTPTDDGKQARVRHGMDQGPVT